MKCKSHYPIIGNWETIIETRTHTTWKCPKCGEEYTSRKHKGVIDHSPQSLKDDRKKYAKHLIQPFREDKFSGEFAKAYPTQTQSMVKSGSVTQSEVTNSKDVWN